MKYLSLFSGIGGFELGISQAYESLSKTKGKQQGWSESNKPLHGKQFMAPQCIGFGEIDKYAVRIYQKHLPEHKNYGDITKIKAEDLPDFDLLCGGFPCQSFSIAGKRGGFNDTRGTMFFEIARILRAKQPRLLLLENVKGLLSHDKGKTFTTIISTLDELGYDLQWQVLNSKNFGVPQNRERVFIVGHLRGTSRPEVFPFCGQSNENTTFGKSAKTAVARTLTGGGHSGGNHSGMTILQVNKPKHSNDRVYSEDGISPTINTMQGGNRQPFVAKTVRSGGQASPHGHNGKIRRLTPTECERLQGFPDGWTEGVSDTQRYKCLGNAVTVNVIKEIALKLFNNPQ